MANRIKAKLILELLDQGMSGREIASTRHISQGSIVLVRKTAREKGITWNSVWDKEEKEVYDLFFPEQAQIEASCFNSDYDYIHNELQKAGVTLQLLYEEYCDQAKENNLTNKSYSTFCRGYHDYVSTKNVTNHLEHKPGQTMEVDWNGTKMKLYNPLSNQTTPVYLFVATLPYSQYSYVEGCLDMKQYSWIMCHIHAWEFFGGVAVKTRCDNLKVGVIKHPREGEIVLNETYEALGSHYRTAIMPTGIRKPKQKASVEGTCGKIASAIVARLRNERFYTLKGLNEAIWEKLKDFNTAPFQKREGSRELIFKEIEQAYLGPLPSVPFEICSWYYNRNVGYNFHVIFEKNYYSVPYTYVKKKVDLKVTESMIEIFINGSRIATHERISSILQYRYKTNASHMPPDFVVSEWDDTSILKWAKSIGENTYAVIFRIFSSVDIKEQAYTPALAILNLTKTYSDAALENACEYALNKTEHPHCRFIQTILASNRTIKKETDVKECGGYIRGESYYGGEGDATC